MSFEPVSLSAERYRKLFLLGVLMGDLLHAFSWGAENINEPGHCFRGALTPRTWRRNHSLRRLRVRLCGEIREEQLVEAFITQHSQSLSERLSKRLVEQLVSDL